MVSGPLVTTPLRVGPEGGTTGGGSSLRGLISESLLILLSPDIRMSGMVGTATLTAVGLSERLAAGFSLTVHCHSGISLSSPSLLRLKKKKH